MRKFRGQENANKIFRIKLNPIGSLSLKSLAKSVQKIEQKKNNKKSKNKMRKC